MAIGLNAAIAQVGFFFKYVVQFFIMNPKQSIASEDFNTLVPNPPKHRATSYRQFRVGFGWHERNGLNGIMGMVYF